MEDKPSENVEVDMSRSDEVLSRETTKCSTIAAWSVVLGSLDTARQLVGYQVTFDGGIRSSLIVLFSECLKLIVLFCFLLTRSAELMKVHKFSLWLLFPASIYAITNNLFYVGVSLVPPPIWAILNQTRVIFLGVVYKFIFKRQFTKYQWTGLFFLLIAVTLTAAKGDDSKHKTYTRSDLMYACIIALGASFLSAIGPIVVEWRLKSDESRSFAVQQFQLYTMGLLSCLVVVSLDVLRKPMVMDRLQMPQLSAILAVVLTAACGLTVGAVMKKTDNVVKELSGIGRKIKVAESLEDEYKLLSETAKSHAVLSMGISCFILRNETSANNEKPITKYLVHTYNFMLMPEDHHTVDPFSIKFLALHEFNFNKLYKSGIHYTLTDRMNENNRRTDKSFIDLLMKMLNCNVPMIVHNGFVDLAFFYQNFISDLPTSSKKFFNSLKENFKGGIFDTKYIALKLKKMRASYLAYMFRKCQKDNVENNQNRNKSIDVAFSDLLTNGEQLSFFTCKTPDYPILITNQICKHFAFNGWCRDGTDCKRSHDLDTIVHINFKFRKCQNKERDETCKEINEEATEKKLSGQHSSGFDAFMTGFAYSFFLNQNEVLNLDNSRNRIYISKKY
ncbi:DgyrCDS8236 [Dimorphilus gyrociliatus]|uniref:DgyrCDS8236 n=1 Tax=Dimorphilus gyrociliatus TaxID=2664684 RepID=A0A7I8VV56_9ANNE|nr:DgyrCDS8236 [Dimorphilus gyrociliatus]